MTEKIFIAQVMPLQNQMYGIAIRFGLSSEVAADCVQDTLLKLWRLRQGIPDDPAGCRLYCLRALRNQCLEVVEKSKPTIGVEEIRDIPDYREDDAEYRDTSAALGRLIESLPPPQREVIKLSGVDGLSNKEIEALTGQSSDNVRQLLSRARRRLRQLFLLINK